MSTIGLLGGTFDPVHIGHLRLAIEVREALALDELHFLPARTPNLRGEPCASGEQRLEMLELALSGADFRVDPRELASAGVSYSIESLEALRRERPNDALCFILGQDAFNGLTRWHRWSAILDYAHLVVAARPGFTTPEDPALIQLLKRAQTKSLAALTAARAGHIWLQPLPLLPIAASDLRARLRSDRSIAHLTPHAVVDYIARNRLYQR
ncbi:MAG: nicotinate-nucleotide adenylyltransferase [Gammaproteobacteria bacterium]